MVWCVLPKKALVYGGKFRRKKSMVFFGGWDTLTFVGFVQLAWIFYGKGLSSSKWFTSIFRMVTTTSREVKAVN